MQTKFFFKGLRLFLAVLAMITAVLAAARPVSAGTALECSDHSLTVKLTPNETDSYQGRGKTMEDV